MNYHILDTETASLKGGVCEIAWLEVDKDLNIVSEFCTLVNPEVPIEEGAMRIHGITEDDVRGKPTLAEVASCFNGPIQMVGHNSAFDKRMIKDAIQIETLICTLKLAREHIKHTTNHKLEVLQKELNLPVQDSHSALGDVHTCRDLLLYLREKHGVTLEDAALRQSIPKMLHTMPFGKHKGRVIANIAPDYRAWLLTQEIDADLRFTLERLKGI
jgi:exodeoxyribonuclease X